MSARGRLTLEKLGYSMPADAPAFQAPPYHYRNAQAVSIKFETDRDAALEVLPAPLELIEPACGNLSFYWYPFTTFGPYHECILRLYARHEGKPLTYVQQIFVDTEPPMLAGREVWGFPKKLASIAFERDRDMIVGKLERPAGVRLATVVMRPEQPVSGLGSNGPTTGLRIIPSADPGEPAPRARRTDRRRHPARDSRSLGGTGLDLLSRRFCLRSRQPLSGAQDRQGGLYGIRHPPSRRPCDRPPMTDAFSRRLEFEGAANFRDLGGYPAAAGRRTRWRRAIPRRQSRGAHGRRSRPPRRTRHRRPRRLPNRT